jgi:PAS domain S-box-containing protein
MQETAPPPAEKFRESQDLQNMPSFDARLRAVSRAAALVVMLIGASVLLGWLLDIPVMKSALPGLVTMKPNAALCFLLAGVALLGLQEDMPPFLRRLVRPSAVVVVGIGLLTIGEYAFGWALGIDQLLFWDTTPPEYPGRMALITAWGFTLIGTALALLEMRRSTLLVTGFVTFVLLNLLMVVVGYLYDINAAYIVRPYSEVALHTAIAFVILCTGIMVLPKDSATYRLLTGAGAGAIMARLLLPTAFMIPIAIGWLEIQGVKAGLYSPEFGRLILTMANIIFFAAVVLRNANVLQRVDRSREQAVGALRQANDDLAVQVWERAVAQEALKTLQEMSIELSKATSFDETCRRAVELGHSGLGFDRISLWFVSEDSKFVAGTYGIDEQGQIRDEHRERIALEESPEHYAHFTQPSSFFHEDVPLYNEKRAIIGRGWNASVPLIDGARIVGRMYADNLLTQEPLPEYAKEVFALYGATVGRLCMQKRAEEDLQHANEQLEARVQERTAALQASEAQYRQIVELAEEGVWTVDAEERVTFVNRRMASMLGYSAEEMLGKSMYSFMDSQDRTTDSSSQQQVWDTLWETDFHFKHKDGGDVWALIAASPLLDDAGEYGGILMMVTDITARKQIEAGLRESEERFRQIAENIDDMFFVREPDFSRILYISPAYDKIWGQSRQMWYDNPRAFMESIHPDDLPNLERALAERVIGGHDLEYRVIRPDGTVRWLRSRTFPILDAQGKVYRTAGVVHDITERKQAQAQIEAERLLLQTVIDNQPDYVFVKDLDGRFMLNNVAHCRSLGKTAQELAGLRSSDVYPPELALNFEADDQAVMQNGKLIVNQEQQTLGEGYTIRWVLTTKVPLRNAEGSITGLVGIARDVTERKQEQAQIEAERLLLQTVINNLPDYIFAKDTEGHFILSNTAHAVSVGKTAQELMGLHARDLYAPEMAGNFVADDNAVIQSGEAVVNQERQTLGVDGKPRWVLTTKVPLRDVNGSITGLVGISRDVTIRKQAQAQVEAERLLLQTVINNLPDYVFAKDRAGHFTLSNAAHSASVGREGETLIGLRARDLFPADLATKFEADDQRVLQSGQPILNQERQTLGADGQTRWVLTSKVPLRDRAGNINGIVGISRDISERRIQELALRESEARFRAMNEASPLGIFLTDAEGNCVYTNANYQRISDLTFQEALGAGWGKAVYLEDRDDVFKGWYEAAQNSSPYTAEHRYQHKDGTIVWASVKAAAIYDGETLLGYVGTVEDITERIRAQDEIHRQQELYRILAGNLPKSAVLLFDHDLRYLLAEGPALAEHGLDKAWMEGKTLWEVVPQERAETLAPHYRRALAGETFNFEWKAPNANIFFAQMLPVKNAEGEVFAGMLVEQDITERKRAEATRAQLAAIVESSYDAILSTDIEGNILSWNKGAEILYGYSAEEIVGKHISLIVPRELPQEVPDVIARMQRGERMEAHETVRLRKDGQMVAIAATISPIRDGEGHVTGISSIHRDINERKLAEQQRVELQLERGKVDVLSRFVGDASHDLKTPLTIIKSSLYLMQKQTDPDKRQRHFNNIEKETERMTTLLDEMLSMSWLDVSQGVREAAPQDINALVKSVVEQYTTLAERKQQQLACSLEDDLPPVQAQRADLQRALVEVIENALYYTPEGGQVQVATASEGKMVKIRVKDSGIGIASDDLKHIFERFYRADKARGTKAGGTGLGLAITKKIIEEHGGRIEVESTPGEGSLFTIFMPVVVE